MAALGCSWAAIAWLILFFSPHDQNLATERASGFADDLAGEVARLAGQRVTITDGGYTIDDIAGEGKPIVGVVERRGSVLVLVEPGGNTYRLAGVLARPRIAGPGYKIWALGPVTGQAPDAILTPRRLGILALPREDATLQVRTRRQRITR